MHAHLWRLRFVGGMILGTGIFFLPTAIAFSIIFEEPRLLIQLISTTGWMVGGYLIYRSASFTGKRLAGFLLVGLSVVTVMSLLGGLLSRLSGL
ncbi:hypothetical protein BZB76_3475 [Actinomadura pelletieri DSM 43383]|uniref:Uncharacterized protein n=1 Tax=Actinomadura pelletieri DSM 43383 TaxID=1120940 RepID=A0A495QPT5_9ACTN|nr:hypothetical protein BZB76_3475 [Actinomadura pelletieri DSM 43383]